jgi:hypothetical protein
VTPSATPESVAADEALEHFGTNAIPTIAWMLRKHDPAWRVKLLLLLEKQHSVPIYHNNPFLWNFAGLKAMEKLGKSGEAAVPVMAEIYDESLQAQSRTSGYIAWGDYMALALPPIWDQLGPPARGAIPSLLRGATFTNGNVRAVAMITLGKIRSEPRLVIPVLTNAFRDPDVLVRQNALIAVSEYGKDAEPAIPAIAEMLNDKEHWVQTAALDALMRLHANPAVTIPALTPSLESTDVFVTLRVARVLLRFGPDARPAVPKMIEAFNRQTDERVRLALRRIIEEIEPGAMARAGIQ